jgi:hypothetical protein
MRAKHKQFGGRDINSTFFEAAPRQHRPKHSDADADSHADAKLIDKAISDTSTMNRPAFSSVKNQPGGSGTGTGRLRKKFEKQHGGGGLSSSSHTIEQRRQAAVRDVNVDDDTVQVNANALHVNTNDRMDMSTGVARASPIIERRRHTTVNKDAALHHPNDKSGHKKKKHKAAHGEEDDRKPAAARTAKDKARAAQEIGSSAAPRKKAAPAEAAASTNINASSTANASLYASEFPPNRCFVSRDSLVEVYNVMYTRAEKAGTGEEGDAKSQASGVAVASVASGGDEDGTSTSASSIAAPGATTTTMEPLFELVSHANAGTLTAEARDPDRRHRVHLQLQHARRLRQVMEDTATQVEADTMSQEEAQQLLHSMPFQINVNELVALTEAARGGYTLDNYHYLTEQQQQQEEERKHQQQLEEARGLLNELLQNLEEERAPALKEEQERLEQEGKDQAEQNINDDPVVVAGEGFVDTAAVEEHDAKTETALADRGGKNASALQHEADVEADALLPTHSAIPQVEEEEDRKPAATLAPAAAADSPPAPKRKREKKVAKKKRKSAPDEDGDHAASTRTTRTGTSASLAAASLDVSKGKRKSHKKKITSQRRKEPPSGAGADINEYLSPMDDEDENHNPSPLRGGGGDRTSATANQNIKTTTPKLSRVKNPRRGAATISTSMNTGDQHSHSRRKKARLTVDTKGEQHIMTSASIDTSTGGAASASVAQSQLSLAPTDDASSIGLASATASMASSRLSGFAGAAGLPHHISMNGVLLGGGGGTGTGPAGTLKTSVLPSSPNNKPTSSSPNHKSKSTAERKCHNCKHKASTYVRCQYCNANGSLCLKPYCRDCLVKDYKVPLESFPALERSSEWFCPSCLEYCVCGACAKERERKERRAQRGAAVARKYTSSTRGV